MTNSKPRIVKDYEKLPEDILNRVKLQYPNGFVSHLVSYTNKEGKKVSALPFETDEVYYLIRMTAMEARQIIEEDEDYDEDGVLRDDFGDDQFDEDATDIAAEEEEDVEDVEEDGEKDF